MNLSKFDGLSGKTAAGPVAVIFHRFGPYHEARLLAATRSIQLAAIQGCRRDLTYAWQEAVGDPGFSLVTLFSESDCDCQPTTLVEQHMARVLDRILPSVVVVPGWSGKLALSAIAWALKRHIPIVVMTESGANDERRVWWKEWIKGRLLKCCSAALAGGTVHADYLLRLGMEREQIFFGYDAVDNAYFSKSVEKVRRQSLEERAAYGLPQRYFLASARFVEKKNLPRLIQAYARYRVLTADAPNHQGTETPWHLVLLGDGPLKPELCRLISDLSLQDSVLLPGFKQYPDLPACYALAGAFIHASTTEQWGLVVNEAMASGLPVLVSNRCGCAPDLVKPGINGFTFDPSDTEELAQLMFKLSMFNSQLFTMGQESQRIVADWGVQRFADGLKAATRRALEIGPSRAWTVDRALLRSLIRSQN